MSYKPALLPNHPLASDAAPVVIRTEALSRSFQRVRAVREVTLSVYRGEIFGLIGPDGAGKTTLLRMLTGVQRPSSGQAQVLGYDLWTQSQALSPFIGYMPQQTHLYPDLSVAENLDFFAALYNVTKKERQERMARLLEFARLAPFRGRRAGQLSGGMQRKLALACTLIHQPHLLFLDEPTTGVDPVSRREFWELLGELNLQGMTIVICTPYMDEAERCTRIAMLDEGRLIACDTPDALRSSIPGDMLELRTQPLLPAQALLERAPGVYEVQLYGDLLHVFVDDAGRRVPELVALLEQANIALVWQRRARPHLDEVFLHLLRHKESAP